ncbi:sulfatase family protein [Seonamhaeicola maritimus]|uniref:sulfatase family protein n=1 Tax=Seonamhaeicola maritimus TaxID=2591822 RepID=UPI002494FC00|nr:sulfatase [Seonamhaeicola maritimus]
MRQIFFSLTLLLTLSCKAQEKPNLLIIHTDEHNFRTLGCYRDNMSEDQAFVWGKGVEVETPNINRIANEGAICLNFYASSPVCSPSRASMVSGMYPVKTAVVSNNIPMKDDIVTFAEVLKQEGYATSYLGKWHLDGDAKPGFSPERQFGFSNNKYMFNRGHWKLLDEVDGKPKLVGKFNPQTQNVKVSIKQADEKTFTTDFLTNKALDIMEADKGGPFCVMISLPDPHTPNIVRAPYDTMFDHLQFEKPKTMKVAKENFPKWVEPSGKNSADHLEQHKMQGYFGMVKCIDDNVGRLLKFLDDNNLADNTIVVFTSDHGDLMGEHRRHNKGLPYETSAKVPFVIRYPKKIDKGITIQKALTMVDFAPTVLGLMNMPQIPESEGLNASNDLANTTKDLIDDRITYITSSAGNWVCGLNNRYKLVLSKKDSPWLFDLVIDPDEIVNFYNQKGYEQISKEIKSELIRQLKTYNDPVLKSKTSLILE